MSTPSKHQPPTEVKISVDDVQKELYAKRQKIYPRQVHGLFAFLKNLSGAILLGIFYLFPWFTWDDRQAVLFDLPAQQFYIFGLVFWPQDLIYLALLLIIAGLALFFFTTLAGRLWCGFACPQTVWTDSFLWMERIVEGDRPQRMKLDKAPFSAKKFRIKATKHTLWIVFSLFTGLTFVGYFSPIRELSMNILDWSLGGWEVFWLFFYGLATYGNAGWLREQICIYMCPYARFQSSMFDKDTMIIAYDEERGEPRGSRKRSDDLKEKNLGACINCTLCVQVCPTGIDIRDGLQYQCISCSACIDVCNDVMDKMKYPRGLIRYTTEHALHHEGTHVFRPRVFVYGGILLALILGLFYSIADRLPIDVDIIRDRTNLYTETNSGHIKNTYMLRLMNKDKDNHDYQLTASGIDGLTLEKNKAVISVAAGEMLDLPISLLALPDAIKDRSNVVHITVSATDNPQISITEESSFLYSTP